MQLTETDLTSSFGDGFSWSRTWDNSGTSNAGGDIASFTQLTGHYWVLPELALLSQRRSNCLERDQPAQLPFQRHDL